MTEKTIRDANISLTAEQDAFIEEMVTDGKYENVSEAMREAVRRLQQRMQEDELRLKLLRGHVKAGLDAFERGDFIEVDDAELDAMLDRLAPSP